MADFLTTSGITYKIEELIKNTQDRLILVSPYLQFNDRIKELIQNLNLYKKDIRIVYRDNKLHPDENNWLAEQVGVRTSICKSLHAKCYMNESEAIITSMNLYEFSQLNNDEMGIKVTKANDPVLYKEIFAEVQRLLTKSEEIRVTVRKVPAEKVEAEKKQRMGYCIRTGATIPFNIEKPMSLEAFRVWNEFANPEYPEKYCHFSGEPSHGETDFLHPILRKNWQQAKAAFRF